MKESTAYIMAQLAVVTSSGISPEDKLRVLKHLIKAEELAVFTERQEEETAVNVE